MSQELTNFLMVMSMPIGIGLYFVYIATKDANEIRKKADQLYKQSRN